jgi:hypothetical protein
MGERLMAEIKVRQSMDEAFLPTKNVMRRNPEKYMRNPAKVFTSTHFSKQFALFDLPGYKNTIISKSKNNNSTLSPDQSDN